MATAKKSAAKKSAAKKADSKGALPLDPNLNHDDPKNAAVKAKTARKIPMYVDSVVHLAGEDKDGKHGVIELRGGVLLEELLAEHDLSDEQVDELIALKAIRPATANEVAAADARAAAAENDE